MNINKPGIEQKWSVQYLKHMSNQSQYSTEILGLAKREYYLFELSANNTAEMGWGEPVLALVYTIDQRERPGAPSKPVISKSSVTDRELTLSWSSGPLSNYGPIRYFKIEVMEVGSGKHGLVSRSDWRTVVDRFYVESNEDSYMLRVGGVDANGE